MPSKPFSFELLEFFWERHVSFMRNNHTARCWYAAAGYQNSVHSESWDNSGEPIFVIYDVLHGKQLTVTIAKQGEGEQDVKQLSSFTRNLPHDIIRIIKHGAVMQLEDITV